MFDCPHDRAAPDDVAALKTRLTATEAALAESAAALAARDAALAEIAEANRRLDQMIAEARREKFGPRSEKLRPDQYNLPLKDVEIAQGALQAAQEKDGATRDKCRSLEFIGQLASGCWSGRVC